MFRSKMKTVHWGKNEQVFVLASCIIAVGGEGVL